MAQFPLPSQTQSVTQAQGKVDPVWYRYLSSFDRYVRGLITKVIAGTGLTGGGSTGDITLSLANTAVTPGHYGGTGKRIEVTLDAQGRCTAASQADLGPADAGITPAALTRTNDTNVTVTLGGTPASALLQAVSIVLGWAGQLSIARGGTGQATASAAFDALSPNTTRGDLTVRGASSNSRLAIGSSGTFLKSDGTDSSWVHPATSDLSDYSEGTWTPTVTTDGTVGTPAYSVRVGSYRKIGSLVVAPFNIQLSGWTGSPTGNVSISGLPFPSANTANEQGHCVLTIWVTAVAISALNGVVTPNTSTLSLRNIAAGGSTNGAASTPASTLGTTPVLEGVIIYHT